MQALLGGPRAELAEDGLITEADVREVYSYARGARIRHRIEVLDTDDEPTGETIPVDRRRGGYVQWGYRPSDAAGSVSTETTAVRRRAQITLVEDVSVNVLTRRFRVVSEFMSLNRIWIPAYLGVFRSVLPSIHDDGIIRTRTLDLTDKSGLWHEKSISERLEVLETDDVVQLVKDQLLDVFGEARTAFPTPTTTTLDEPMFFNIGTPYIKIWNKLFQAIGIGQVYADEEGRPAAQLLSDLANKGSEWKYGPGAQGKIVRAGTLQSLIPSLPNVLTFTSRRGPSLPELGNGITIRRNVDYGPGSINARGGEEVPMDIETDAVNHDELEAIADSEQQRYFAGGGDRFEGQIALNPLHSDQDVVTFDRPRLGVPNMLSNMTNWRYPLAVPDSNAAVLMSVTAERRVIGEVVNASASTGGR